MKRLLLTILTVSAIGFIAPVANAQMMGGLSNSSAGLDETAEHTLLGEQEGKELWNKLQAEKLNCDDLSNDDFHALGMHFMGLMVGDSHEAMDVMMERMMGEEGENQMHIAMGKRMSGCEPNAPKHGGWWYDVNDDGPRRDGRMAVSF